jgi:transaldolase
MNSIVELHRLGQSIWYDNIERRLLRNGEMASMITAGLIRGVTSNPSIFNNAIAKSSDYDEDLIPLAQDGKTALQIYEALAVADIQAACDLFLPIYQSSQGSDGFVSLEVSPYLANKTAATLKDAVRLWGLVARPNLMIKIPGTQAGLPAITRAIAQGINVNVTLIFSLKRYAKVMDAFLKGLEQRVEAGDPIDQVASVASFFVSRIDTNVDNRLQDLVDRSKILLVRAREVQGKIAIASAKLAFELNKATFSGDRWEKLHAKGGRLQRPLWASTSTKNPEYADTRYVDELIGPNTVNTIPPKTLKAFEDHGTVALTLETGLDAAREAMDDLSYLGVSIDEVTQELEVQGVKSFADAFTALLDSIENRRLAALQSQG